MAPRLLIVEASDRDRTVQAVLHDRGGVSHSAARAAVASGAVRVNGEVVLRPDRRMAPGDRIEIRPDPGATRRISPLKAGRGYRPVYEDRELIVVDKSAGLLTVPAPTGGVSSLVERLLGSYRRRGIRDPGLWVVHRIDRFTSGLVVFARTPSARTALRKQFVSGSPARVYLAVAEGVLETDRGRLVDRLESHPKSHKVRPARGTTGVTASCRFRVLERFEHATLLEVTLETGRRNQIRVQLAARGHPLVGDVAYGRPSPLVRRAALHAARLGLAHPADGRRLDLRADPPEDLVRLLALLRKGARPVPEPPTRRTERARRYK